jgi:hypothetical protein
MPRRFLPHCVIPLVWYASAIDSLHATIEEFAAKGFTHVECYCPRCRMIRLRPITWLPRISSGSPSRSFQHGCAVQSAAVKCNRLSRGEVEEVLGKPLGRRA